MPSPSKSAPTKLIGLFPELLGIGGVQEAGRQTALALDEIARKHGWRLQLYSLNDAPGEHDLPEAEHQICFRAFGRKKISFVQTLVRMGIALNGDSVHIVIAAHPNLALPAWLVRKCSRSLRTILMTHGVEIWTRLSLIRWNALSRADLILGPSGDTVKKLVDVQGIAPVKIRKLPWPLSQSFLSLVARKTHLELPHGFPRGLVILTVGRWASSERYKGADDLIRAASILSDNFPNLHLVIVGQGDDLPRLQKLVTDTGVAKSVCFLERVSRSELAACYAHADVFALPSTGEGFGLVFLEAMAFAKPIVAAAWGGATDLVEHGVNGLLVSPGDVRKLAEALESLLTNHSLRNTLGVNGAKLVNEKFGFDNFVVQLEKIVLDSMHS